MVMENNQFAKGQEIGQRLIKGLFSKNTLEIMGSICPLITIAIPERFWDKDPMDNPAPASAAALPMPKEDFYADVCVVCGKPSQDGETHVECRG